LQDNVKLDSLAQEKIDVAEDEIHYENEGYYRHREEKRADVVS
jgi:hypothetical protein